MELWSEKVGLLIGCDLFITIPTCISRLTEEDVTRMQTECSIKYKILPS